ncbi:MAG: acyl-CoA-binding protein [Chitinophagaceae bacterium]
MDNNTLITAAFQQAVVESKQLPSKPDNDTLLKLYSLYKQATDGDAPATSDAGMFDFVAAAKYNAWHAIRGKDKEEAMKDYMALVADLKAK